MSFNSMYSFIFYPLSANCLAITCWQGKVEVGAGVEVTSKQTLGISADTPLAYSMHELRVDKETGQFKIVVDPGCHGGFVTNLFHDTVDFGVKSGEQEAIYCVLLVILLIIIIAMTKQPTVIVAPAFDESKSLDVMSSLC